MLNQYRNKSNLLKESKKKSDVHDVRDETVFKDGLNKDTFDLFLELLEFEILRIPFKSLQEEIGVRESLTVARNWVQGTLNWKQAVEGLFTMTTARIGFKGLTREKVLHPDARTFEPDPEAAILPKPCQHLRVGHGKDQKFFQCLHLVDESFL